MKNNVLTKYVRESFHELQKVTWPTKNQAIKITAIVLVFTFIFAGLLGLADFVFGLGYHSLLKFF